MTEARIVICGRYELSAQLFSSSNYIFFAGFNLESRERLFIKAEERLGKRTHELMIMNQCRSYQMIQGGPGIPSLYWCGQDGDFNFLVIQQLHKQNLEQVFERHNRTFSVKTIIQIGLQTLESIRYLHTKGLVYNNINSRHILPGIGSSNHKLHLVDYSSCMPYKNQKNNQLKQLSKQVAGSNILFSSVHVHSGQNPSRVDDIQSWFYLLAYLFAGELPWMVCPKMNKLNVLKKKKDSMGSELIVKGAPEEIKAVWRYVKSVAHEERPDYQYLKNLLQKLASRQHIMLDNIFDWTLSTPPQPLASTYPQQLSLNIQLVQNQKEFLQQQYQLYLQQAAESNNISNLLSQTLNESCCYSEVGDDHPVSLPESQNYQKQNCLLF